LGAAFNELLQLFVPKGGLPLDSTEVTREPCDTRTLACENTGHKVLAGASNDALRKSVAAGISPLQRGFVAGRQLEENPILLDAAARRYAAKPDAFYPALALFDYGAAFPTLAH